MPFSSRSTRSSRVPRLVPRFLLSTRIVPFTFPPHLHPLAPCALLPPCILLHSYWSHQATISSIHFKHFHGLKCPAVIALVDTLNIRFLFSQTVTSLCLPYLSQLCTFPASLTPFLLALAAFVLLLSRAFSSIVRSCSMVGCQCNSSSCSPMCSHQLIITNLHLRILFFSTSAPIVRRFDFLPAIIG